MYQRPKDLLAIKLDSVFQEIQKDGLIPQDQDVRYTIEAPKQKQHGDFATNMAMVCAKLAKKNPRELAQVIIDKLQVPDNLIISAEIAGPGFINFKINDQAHREIIGAIIDDIDGLLCTVAKPQKILIEFVSANPTGPLHVGHGRGAVTGDTLARMLRRAGHQVTTEYYINDAGRQVELLAQSVWARYQEMCGVHVAFDEEFYKGEYIKDIARILYEEHGEDLYKQEDSILICKEQAIEIVLNWIKEDLAEFGVEFDVWTSERSLYERIDIPGLMRQLQEKGHLYEEDGKQWFKTTDFGDEKDRVVIREDGRPTYFASDIAYHDDKCKRGFDQLINVWGADHVGYIARVKAGLEACGHAPEKLNVVLVQMVNLLRDGQPVKMGKRSGSFILLKELFEEAGKDPARFFFILRSSDAQLDFDISIATKKSLDNPVYYVQYGHARMCSIIRQAKSQGIDLPEYNPQALEALALPVEIELCKKMAMAPDIVRDAAEALEPHRIVYYLRELISDFHSYYTGYKQTDRVISEDLQKTSARLLFCYALQQLLADLLNTIGIHAPQQMTLEQAGDVNA